MGWAGRCAEQKKRHLVQAALEKPGQKVSILDRRREAGSLSGKNFGVECDRALPSQVNNTPSPISVLRKQTSVAVSFQSWITEGDRHL